MTTGTIGGLAMLVIGIYYNYFICHIIFKILMDIPKPYRKFAGIDTALFELYTIL